jgi:hypothetical protein
MPFDGIGFSAANEHLEKIDAVIDLIQTPERWAKGSFRTPDGRYCLRGAIKALDKSEVLTPSVIDAINQIASKKYYTIERFNDNPSTTHAMVLSALARARENIATGRLNIMAPAQSRSLLIGDGATACCIGCILPDLASRGLAAQPICRFRREHCRPDHSRDQR